MNIYYVYAYLRQDGTPYYVGKGRDNRAYEHHNSVHVPKDKSHIEFIAKNLTEQSALDLEMDLIQSYGRKDLGTGILRNLTDGGEGVSGLVHSESSRRKMSNAHTGKTLSASHIENMRLGMLGKNKKPKSEETKRKISETLSGRKLGKYSQEHCFAISEGKKSKNFRHSDVTKRKISETKLNAAKQKELIS
jgi:hypothetical protein